MWSPRSGSVGSSDLESHVRSLNTKAKGVQGERSVLDVEWVSLGDHARAMAKDASNLTTCGERPENRERNRYPDVLPNDKTRVKLRANPENPAGYINSSFIDGKAFCLPHHNYICAQAPRENTVDDFWRMIWENDIALVLMLTREIENSKVKCARYWPATPTPEDTDPVLHSGDMLIRWQFLGPQSELRTEERHGDLLVKHFTVLCHGQRRSVTHIQHLEWPDHGVPTGSSSGLQHLIRISDEYIRSALRPDADIPLQTEESRAAAGAPGDRPEWEEEEGLSLISLRAVTPNPAQLVSAKRRRLRYTRPVDRDNLSDYFEGNSVVPPILVHCSAGIGRTGCFITVHILVALFKQAFLMWREHSSSLCPNPDRNPFRFHFDVLGAIKTLRTQRPGMVQSIDQLCYIYHTLLQEYRYLRMGGFSDLEPGGGAEGEDGEGEAGRGEGAGACATAAGPAETAQGVEVQGQVEVPGSSAGRVEAGGAVAVPHGQGGCSNATSPTGAAAGVGGVPHAELPGGGGVAAGQSAVGSGLVQPRPPPDAAPPSMPWEQQRRQVEVASPGVTSHPRHEL